MSVAFDKRVKRRVCAREHEFFASCAPGVEPLLERELESLGYTGLIPDRGGVGFACRPHEMYEANLASRLANRVIMRVASFTVRDFSTLERAAESIDWELYLPAGAVVSVHAACRKSRLYHDTAVSERVLAAALRRLGPPGAGTGAAQQVFVRLVNDRATVSVDTSGPLLHFRGVKDHGGRAPLRETLAAAVLHAAEWGPNVVLADPMCGSGAFTVEAAAMVSQVPPGWFRDFAFMSWPGFEPGRWAALGRRYQARFRSPEKPVVHASDSDASACLRLGEALAGHGLADAAVVRPADFFHLDPGTLAGKPGLLVLNPPYGVRLHDPERARELFSRICARMGSRWKGWRAAVLCPDPAWMPELPLPCPKVLRFAHGGLDVHLAVGGVR